MTTYSTSRSLFGDIDSSRSQLGIGWSGIAASGPLWSIAYACNHYCISSTSDIILTLPEVGVLSNQAQPGHWLTISNTNTGPFMIMIQNSTSNPINSITPNGSIKLIADSLSSTQWTVVYDECASAVFRANVDPQSNPDPTLNGLIVPPNAGQFNMPITVSPQGLQLADGFINDPSGFYTISTDTFSINRKGDFRASFSVFVIGIGATQNHSMVAQLMDNSFNIYSNPPIIAAGSYAGELITSPITGVAWYLTGSAVFTVDTTPVTIALKCIFDNDTDVVIALTSNISIELIDKK